MIEQLAAANNNVLAIEVIDGFTDADEALCQKIFQAKLDHGYQQVHVLVKLDRMKIKHSSVKAFMEDTIWVLRHYRQIGHLAIVAHTKIQKALVPIDNLFFERASKGRLERYFDSKQLGEAMAFVNEYAIEIGRRY